MFTKHFWNMALSALQAMAAFLCCISLAVAADIEPIVVILNAEYEVEQSGPELTDSLSPARGKEVINESAQSAQDSVDETLTPEEVIDDTHDATPPAVFRQALLFTADWCRPCQTLKRRGGVLDLLKDAGWRIGNRDNDHIRYVDCTGSNPLQRRYGVSQLPTIVIVEDGREVDRKVYPFDQWDIGELMDSKTTRPRAKQPVRSKSRLTPGQLRDWCRGYTGQVAYVRGMTLVEHICDPSAEAHTAAFERWQLQGLSTQELQKIHGAQHAGLIDPYGAIQ